MKILVAGLGSIGRRHLANLDGVAPTATKIVWRLRSRAGADDVQTPGAVVVHSLDDALAQTPDAALITGPASCHVDTSLPLAGRGVHLLIEKPLSNALDGVDDLVAVCRESQTLLMVGYCFRFYRPLQSLRQAVADGRIGRVLSIRAEFGHYLPEWRPGFDYRHGVSAQRALGGGVLLEMSHELDYVRWVAGEVATVNARVARLSDLDIDVEDTADILLEFTSGATGSVHLDMVQRSPRRACRVVGTSGTLTWDGLTHEVLLYSAANGRWTQLHGTDPGAYDEMYRVELRHFLDGVNGRPLEGATPEDGKRIVEIVLAIQRSSDERRVINLN